MHSFPLTYKFFFFNLAPFFFNLGLSNLFETIHIIHGMMEVRLGEIPLGGGAQDVDIAKGAPGRQWQLLLQFSLEAEWLGV